MKKYEHLRIFYSDIWTLGKISLKEELLVQNPRIRTRPVPALYARDHQLTKVDIIINFDFLGAFQNSILSF